jgi:hypothetical protein
MLQSNAISVGDLSRSLREPILRSAVAHVANLVPANGIVKLSRSQLSFLPAAVTRFARSFIRTATPVDLSSE